MSTAKPIGYPIGISVAKKIGSITSPYGVNILDNGDFSDGGTGWNSIDVTVDYSSGYAEVTDGLSSGARVYRANIPVEIGATYVFEGDAEIITPGSTMTYYVKDNGGSGIMTLSLSGTGWNTYNGEFIPSAASVDLWLRAGTGGAVNFDNISIRKVL